MPIRCIVLLLHRLRSVQWAGTELYCQETAGQLHAYDHCKVVRLAEGRNEIALLVRRQLMVAKGHVIVLDIGSARQAIYGECIAEGIQQVEMGFFPSHDHFYVVRTCITKDTSVRSFRHLVLGGNQSAECKCSARQSETEPGMYTHVHGEFRTAARRDKSRRAVCVFINAYVRRRGCDRRWCRARLRRAHGRRRGCGRPSHRGLW